MSTTTSRLGLTKAEDSDNANTFIKTDLGANMDTLDNSARLNGTNTFTSAGSIDMSATATDGGLKLPQGASAAPTGEGNVSWDTDDDLLKVGTGAATKVMVDTNSTQTLTGKTLTSPVVNVTSDATGDLYYRNGSGLFTRLPVGSSAQVLVGGTTPAWGSAPLTVIGPTFASATVTMTSSATQYTAVTLGSALVNGATYLISGATYVSCTASDRIVFRLFDSTNSVTIAETTIGASAGSNPRAGVSFGGVKYSGFSGTPTIVLQAYNADSAGSVIQVSGNASNKDTWIQAVVAG